MENHNWYTVVSYGTAWTPKHKLPPTGPWRGEEAAREALGRWKDRMGHETGTLMAAHAIRIVGPFCTRAKAKDADISDYYKHTCRCAEVR